MIVAERKSIPELVDMLRGHKKILALGCGTCVSVCLAGGEREVSIITSALREDGYEVGQARNGVDMLEYLGEFLRSGDLLSLPDVMILDYLMPGLTGVEILEGLSKATVYTSVRDCGVLLTIRYLCDPRRRRSYEESIWEDVLHVFAENDDIDFAYPTQRFYDNLTEGKAGTKPEAP